MNGMCVSQLKYKKEVSLMCMIDLIPRFFEIT